MRGDAPGVIAALIVDKKLARKASPLMTRVHARILRADLPQPGVDLTARPGVDPYRGGVGACHAPCRRNGQGFLWKVTAYSRRANGHITRFCPVIAPGAALPCHTLPPTEQAEP